MLGGRLLTLREDVQARKTENAVSDALDASGVGLAFALGIQRIVNDKLTVENFMIAQPKTTEARGNPAEAFSRWMRDTRDANRPRAQFHRVRRALDR